VHLLYLDESGNPDDAADGHFVLAGVSVFERMAGKFDRQGARLHGLTHLKRDKSQPCECMACAGRRGQLALPDLST
jgi:hypothetical protein